MKILDRYLIWEMVGPFLLTVVAFALVMATDLIFTLIDLIINKGVPVGVVVRLITLKLPAIMVLAFPVATLFAVVLSLGRMAKDNEITALRTSGLPLLRLSVPIIILSIFISGLAYFTNERVVPWANHLSDNLIRQLILKQPLPEIREHVFFRDRGQRFFYVGRVDAKANTLERIMVYELGEAFPRVITAKQAHFESGAWDLEEGIIHKYDEKGYIAYEARFDKMHIAVTENILTLTEQKTPAEMNTQELKNMISLLKKGGVSTQALLVDLHLKFSIPAACFIFALLGIPLSLPSVRAGRGWGIVLSVFVVMTFYVTASILRSFGRGGILPPLASAWLPHFCFAALALVFILREGLFK